jgi:hypothetical protein
LLLNGDGSCGRGCGGGDVWCSHCLCLWCEYRVYFEVMTNIIDVSNKSRNLKFSWNFEHACFGATLILVLRFFFVRWWMLGKYCVTRVL